jgi:hypothetical protein
VQHVEDVGEQRGVRGLETLNTQAESTLTGYSIMVRT